MPTSLRSADGRESRPLIGVRGRLWAAVALAAAGSLATPALGAPPRLRLDGIGPLEIGMPRSRALATGWIAGRRLGCEIATPRPVVYALTGARTPRGLRGSVEFISGRLTSITVTAGARTATGVRPGVTTAAAMARTYRAAGYLVTSSYAPMLGVRLVDARRGGKRVEGVAVGRFAGRVVRSLSIPFAPVCE